MGLTNSTRRYVRFVISVTFLHVLTYFVIGSLAYFIIYAGVIESGGFDQYIRNPNIPDEWEHVEIWVVPAQFLRGVLFGLAFCPFLKTLAAWSYKKRFLVLLMMLIILSILNVTMPGAGSIEGWVYLRPATGPELPNPLLGFIEVPLQLTIFSALVAYRIGKIVSD